MNFPKRVTIVEVGLRDGLQNECTKVSTEQKLSLLQDILSSGIKTVEIGSFVRPDKVPQMADTGELFRYTSQMEGVPDCEFRALIPNRRGLENAIASGCKHVKIGVSASRIHNMRNYNRTPEESIEAFDSIFQLAKDSGVEVIGTVQMAFGSPWEGEIQIENILPIIKLYHENRISRVGLGDTASMANPKTVYNVCATLTDTFPDIQFKAHFHNARGLGLSNVLAAMAAGITEFDASFAGLGGCPFVPEAAGNISTEDLLNLMNELGIEPGVDIERTIKIGEDAERIVGHVGNSFVLRAGTSRSLMERTRQR